jgi:hypothetical protein
MPGDSTFHVIFVVSILQWMNLKLLNALLIIASLLGYLEWGAVSIHSFSWQKENY